VLFLAVRILEFSLRHTNTHAAITDRKTKTETERRRARWYLLIFHGAIYKYIFFLVFPMRKLDCIIFSNIIHNSVHYRSYSSL